MTRMPAPADKTRAELKRESLGRILLAGSRRLRREGLDRTAAPEDSRLIATRTVIRQGISAMPKAIEIQ